MSVNFLFHLSGKCLLLLRVTHKVTLSTHGEVIGPEYRSKNIQLLFHYCEGESFSSPYPSSTDIYCMRDFFSRGYTLVKEVVSKTAAQVALGHIHIYLSLLVVENRFR